MAIVKRGSRVSRVSGQLQSQTQCSSSTDDDDSKGKQSRPYGDDDDVDSGAGSDTSDGSDVGEKGSELCQVGDQSCAIPYELFDLPDLGCVLSLDTWNYCLTEEERFELSAYLPDMDQETFVHTLKELLAGENFHFGSPLVEPTRPKCPVPLIRYRVILELVPQADQPKKRPEANAEKESTRRRGSPHASRETEQPIIIRTTEEQSRQPSQRSHGPGGPSGNGVQHPGPKRSQGPRAKRVQGAAAPAPHPPHLGR